MRSFSASPRPALPLPPVATICLERSVILFFLRDNHHPTSRPRIKDYVDCLVISWWYYSAGMSASGIFAISWRLPEERSITRAASRLNVSQREALATAKNALARLCAGSAKAPSIPAKRKLPDPTRQSRQRSSEVASYARKISRAILGNRHHDLRRPRFPPPFWLKAFNIDPSVLKTRHWDCLRAGTCATPR